MTRAKDVKVGELRDTAARIVGALLRRSPKSVAPLLRHLLARIDPSLESMQRHAAFEVGGRELYEVPGLRDALKPGWASMLGEQSRPAPRVTELSIRNEVAVLDRMHRILSATGWREKDATVVEIGPHLGQRAAALGLRGHRVIGIDNPAYYLAGAQSSNREEALTETRRWLESIREDVIRDTCLLGDVDSLDVEFRHEDFLETALPSEVADLVVSWEVLEHIVDVDAMFSQIRRLLRPGGFSFHEYNPFFCLTGGHSLGTTDIPWGHARLCLDDFESYVRARRPDEADQDVDFLSTALNRVTISGMERAAQGAGLEVLATVQVPTLTDLRFMDKETLAQVRASHGDVRLEDLLVRTVWCVARRAYD